MKMGCMHMAGWLAGLALLLGALCSAAAWEIPLTQVERAVALNGTLPATCSESEVGTLVAEATRRTGETQLAAVPAGWLESGLEAGALYAGEVDRVIGQDYSLCTAVLSPAQLKAWLEYGVSRLVTDEGERIDLERSAWEGFPQMSGLVWTYDVSAPAGQRVLSVQLEGEALDLTAAGPVLSLTAPRAMLDGGLGYPELEWTQTEYTARASLLSYIQSAQTLEVPTKQATVVGTASYPLAEQLPLAAIVGACILIAVFSSVIRRTYKKHFTFENA